MTAEGGTVPDYQSNLSGRILAALAGCYAAPRAAALSGVPVSTVYNWARLGIVTPSVSPTRQKLWSYADLMALRIVYWLRHPKSGRAREVPASPMSQVREALEELEKRGLDIWAENEWQQGSPLRVDLRGRVHLTDGWTAGMSGQMALAETLDLLGPFEAASKHGPDLLRPRSQLRIIPGKVSGEPHLNGSRVTTRAVAALYRSVGNIKGVAAFYPILDTEAIAQGVELERSLAA